MIQLPFEKRLVVARVLTKYVDQHTGGNEAVIAALEKWIDLNPTRLRVRR